MESILRSQVMAIINSGRPISSLEFVTADRRRGTGGDLVECRNWMKVQKDMPVEGRPGFHTKKHTPKVDRNNHSNKTFLIFNPANRSAHPITVHYRLMQSINGKHISNG
jgi:hypothetical protein